MQLHKHLFIKLIIAIFTLWTYLLSASLEITPETYLRKTADSLQSISTIPKKVKKAISPYLIPDTHPMKASLDNLFHSTRVTLDQKSFERAGFISLSVRPRTHIIVATHPLLPNHLVKLTLDSELREKQNKPSWEWLVKRCQGAEKIRHIIRSKKIKHFTVASKWIYPLPDKPAPPKSSKYNRHLAILLVTDMKLVPQKENLLAWRYKITKEHLDELYTVISYAKGSSYRADNISYTMQGKFAFIDTEYPSRGPDYESIRPYLHPSMRNYWDKLVKEGGK